MPDEKKSVKKSTPSSSRRINKFLEESIKNNQMLQEKILVNLVEIQKVHTNLAEKFDKLTQEISGLLNLFEMAARSFASHPANQVDEKDKDFLDKIDKLLEQNKTIAKGLTLMEERIREKVYGFPSRNTENQQRPIINKPQKPEENEYEMSQINRPLPKF